MAPSYSLLLLISLSTSIIFQLANCQQQMYVVERPDTDSDEIVDPATSNEEQRFSSHIVALRPDYTFWKMVNVLKSMFDSRTTEKRRNSRDTDPLSPLVPNLRSRRLLLNFGHYRH